MATATKGKALPAQRTRSAPRASNEKIAVYEVEHNLVQIAPVTEPNQQDPCYRHADEIVTSDDFAGAEMEQRVVSDHAVRLLARVRRAELKEWLAEYREMKENAAGAEGARVPA